MSYAGTGWSQAQSELRGHPLVQPAACLRGQQRSVGELRSVVVPLICEAWVSKGWLESESKELEEREREKKTTGLWI